MTPKSYTLFLGLFVSALALSSCTPKNTTQQPARVHAPAHSEALNAWFQDRYLEDLARSPMSRTALGDKSGQDRLDDVSQTALDEAAALKKSWLTQLRRDFDPDLLDDQSNLSRRLFEFEMEDDLASHSVSDHDYVFQHMSGPHTNLPAFMINFHRIDNKEDAKAYISRLKMFDEYLSARISQAEKQYEVGVMLPKFVYPKLISASQNVISGAPFDTNENSALLDDFTKKVNALDISSGEKEALIEEARVVLLTVVQPTYANLITMFERHEIGANDDDGAWKLPNGDSYYQAKLKHYTTTDLSADEIHDIGLQEVARIQDEMREIMRSVGFEGSLQEFFTYLRTDDQFTYSDDDDGRQAYIDLATSMIDDMRKELDDLFITKPKANMIVKRVEPFREATAFGAFYNRPAQDGSRPGTYYINLKDMSELPIYQMQALAYHEGIPGHHMQIAIGMELEDIPKFRTQGSHTAYVEGWALYSESIPKELGLYTDPYQDFGRLSMEIFRAARLVLDTGIHHKKWSRDQAVEYMMENTANSEGDIRAEIDRYIVWPGQATAYKIGMLKIQELRRDAETKLGDDFDIREFHDVILANGSVPLSVLEELVDQWVSTQSGKD